MQITANEAHWCRLESRHCEFPIILVSLVTKDRNSYSLMEQQEVWNGHVTFTWRFWKFSVIRKLFLPWNSYFIDTLTYWNSPWQPLRLCRINWISMGFVFGLELIDLIIFFCYGTYYQRIRILSELFELIQ